MTPEAQIASLDRMLADRGEDVVLVRGAKPDQARVTCRVKVVGYDPDELVGDISQQDSKVIMSPTQITAAGWPGAVMGDPLPVKGDRMIIQGSAKTVQAGTAITAGGKTVRIEARVRGEAS